MTENPFIRPGRKLPIGIQSFEFIRTEGYLIPYTTDGRQLVKVGIDFNHSERNLGDWIIG